MPTTGRRPNEKLRAKRVERALTQEELAEELTQLRWQSDPDAPPVTGPMISTWERGRRPRPHHRRLLCDYFQASQDELGLRAWPAPPAEGPESAEGRYDGPLGGATTRRRTFVAGAAGAVAALAADPLLTALARLQHLAGSSIGAAIDGFESLVADLGLNYSREPVARLYARLDGLLSILQELLDSGTPKSYARRLQSIAGWSAGLLSNALYDLGDSAAANVNAVLALEYGRRARDQRLVAYVRNRQAMYAESGGSVADALRLTREGLAAAPERTWIGVRLRCAEATLAARLGREQEARDALRHLQTASDTLPAVEVGEGSFNVSTVFLDHALAGVLPMLGELDAAHEHVAVVVNHYAAGAGLTRRPTRLAGAQFDLARILLGQGRPEEAAAVASQALATDRPIAPILMWAGSFDAALHRRYPELPEAHRFREHYVALEAASQAPPEG